MDTDKINAMNLFRKFQSEREKVIESKMESLRKTLEEVDSDQIQDLHDLQQALFHLGNVQSSFNLWLMDGREQKPTFRFNEKKWDKL
jgi:uncharacterized glyoxalase superfamily metalloenzyme YdcJ